MRVLLKFLTEKFSIKYNFNIFLYVASQVFSQIYSTFFFTSILISIFAFLFRERKFLPVDFLARLYRGKVDRIAQKSSPTHTHVRRGYAERLSRYYYSNSNPLRIPS